jgi:hypothetical protein
MAVSQIAEDLVPSVYSANVAFRVVLIDPWIDSLRAPMLKLNLRRWNQSQ